MAILSELIHVVSIIKKSGNVDIQIRSIQYDSRKVSPGDLFVAIKGGKLDGHDYIDAAIRQGASAVVGELSISDNRVPYIQVGNSRAAMAYMASVFYGHPSRSMKMIGITGTNGKTSTVYLIDSILQANGIKTGILGTVVYRVGTEEIAAGWTTPESSVLYQLLHSMLQHKTEAVVMEISSHALEQYRVEGLEFRLAIFTNLSQDHLDYHRSMDQYATAKQQLFRQVDPALGENIINGDDPMSLVMAKQNRRPVLIFSAVPGKADVFPERVEFSFKGISTSLHTPKGRLKIRSPLLGWHNLYNIMAAVSVGICLDVPAGVIEKGIKNLVRVPGRLEPVDEGQPFSVLVDYAHTPDAMEKVINAVRELVTGNLIVVFGCGGDRDRTKRPLMGSVAEKGADRAILTSDNPRTEDPMKIINDTLEGVKNKDSMEVFVDRTEAIHRALDVADKSDCVLILGKGHETYQVIGTQKNPYDDRKTARNFLRDKFKNRSLTSGNENEPIDATGYSTD
ncbi:hypothetical protein AMJ80_09980 [bacterium SM23_31]|nr:MAG: hypothetical protein AMJ80_09980 [bacterium SM23_31]